MLQCPSGWHAQVVIYGYLATDDYIYLYGDNGTSLSFAGAVATTAFTYTYLYNSSVGTAKFVSNTANVAAGMWINMTCRLSQCMAYNTTTFTYKDYSGTLDLVPGTAYMINEACDFNIQCPNNMFVGFSSITGTLSALDTWQFIDAVAGKVILTLTSTLYPALMMPSSQALIRFRSNFDKTAVAGLVVTFKCYVQQCSSNTTTVINDAITGGTIKSDTDGATSTVKYMANENCEWAIKCKTGSASSITGLTGNFQVTTDIIEVWSASNVKLAAWSRYSATSGATYTALKPSSQLTYLGLLDYGAKIRFKSAIQAVNSYSYG